MALRDYILPKLNQPSQDDLRRPTGLRAFIESLMSSAQGSVSDRVTMGSDDPPFIPPLVIPPPQPPKPPSGTLSPFISDRMTPELGELQPLNVPMRPGDTFRPLSPETRQVLGIPEPEPYTPEELAGLQAQREYWGNQPKPPTFLEKPLRNIGQVINEAQTTPLFEIAGIPVSSYDLASVGMLAFGGAIAAKQGWDLFLRSSLRRNLNSWAKSAGKTLEKETADSFINAAMANLSKKYLSGQALKTIFKPTKSGYAISDPVMAKQATQETSNIAKEFVKTLTKFTETNTAVPGQARSLASIMQGARAELPPEMLPGTSVQAGLAGMGKEAAQTQMFGETGKPTGQMEPLVDAEAIKAMEANKPLPGQIGLESRQSVAVPVDQIGVDPQRFQFKQGLNTETGTSNKLADATYNPILGNVTYGWQDKQGKIWIVNGHHRLDLAKRSGTQSINMFIDRETAGVTEAEARANGALINIAEDQGTPFDVAKFLKDSGKGLDYLVQFGIAPNGRLASKGVAISQLDDSLFQKVGTGQLDQDMAAIIGNGLPGDFANQREVAKIATSGSKDLTPKELTALIKEAKAAGTAKISQATLFGQTETEKSLLITRAKLRSWIEDELAKDKRLFGYVTGKGRPEALARGGTKVNVEAGTNIAQESATAHAIFDAKANAVGPINDIITEGTAQIAQGGNLNEIRNQTIDRIRATIAGKEPARPRDDTPSASISETAKAKVQEVTPILPSSSPMSQTPSTSPLTSDLQPGLPPASTITQAEVKPVESLPVSPEIPPAVPPGNVPPAPPQTNAVPSSASAPKEGFLMADLQDAQTAIDIANKPDMARKFANLPGIKQVQGVFNPSAIADKPAEQAVVLRGVLRDEGQQKSQGVIAHLMELGDQNKVFGKLDKEGRIAEGALKGSLVNDIRTYPNKYKLTDQQKEWVKRADEIEKAKLDFLKRNGVEVNELSFEEGGQYAGRKVYAKISQQGEILDSGYVGAGPGRPGAKTSAEKARQFANVEEAVKAGYRYLPEDEALYLNVQGAYNRVADKKMAEWLLTQVEWRTTGAPEELVLAAESARLKVRKSEQLLAALNRTLRGERGVPDQIVNSIQTVYPQEAQQLRDLITKIRAGEKTGDEVQAFTNKIKQLIVANKKAFNAAVNTRARARESAMSPRYGEASIQAPAFAGKVFTGPEARETANILRQSFDPRFSKALDAVNKVNAIGRYFALAGDISPMTIQLLFLAGENPKIYDKAGAGLVRAIFDPEFHANYLSKNKAVIDASPNLILSKAGATEYTEAMGKTGLLKKGPAKVAGATLEPFQRGFEAALDVAGIELKKAYLHKATTPEATAQIDQFINEFRGLTSSARLGVSASQRQIETALILAPRYNRAIAGLLFDVFQGNLRGSMARKSMARGVAAVVAASIAISLALGENKDEIAEHLNPNSSKFLTWQIAGQNVGPGTKIRSVINVFAKSIKAVKDGEGDRLLEFSMDNPGLAFLRGNLSPAVSTSIDIWTGKDYIGDPTRDGLLSFTKTVLAENLMPLWVQSLIYEGTGVQQKLMGAAAQFTGLRNYPTTEYQAAAELRDKYAQTDFNINWKDLNTAQKKDLIRKYEDLKQAEETSKQATLKKGTQEEKAYASATQQAIEKRNGDLEKAAQDLLDGKITKYNYDSERGFIRPYYSGARSALWQFKQELDPKEAKRFEAKMNESTKPEDKALDAYWEYYNNLLDKSDLPKDWDQINADLETYLNKLPLKVSQYIREQKDAWIKDLPPAAQKVEMMRLRGIENETWWNDYRGKTSTFNIPSPFGSNLPRTIYPSSTIPKAYTPPTRTPYSPSPTRTTQPSTGGIQIPRFR